MSLSLVEDGSRTGDAIGGELLYLLGLIGAARVEIEGDRIVCNCLWPQNHYGGDENEQTLSFDPDSTEYECPSCGAAGDEYSLRYLFREEIERRSAPVLVEPDDAEFQGLAPFLPGSWDQGDPLTWAISGAAYDAALERLNESLREPEPEREREPSDRTLDWRQEQARPLSELVSRWGIIARPKHRAYLASPPGLDKEGKPGNYGSEQSIYAACLLDNWSPVEAGKLALELQLPRFVYELERQGSRWLCECWKNAHAWLEKRSRAFGTKAPEAFFGRPRPQRSTPRPRFERKQSSHKRAVIEKQRDYARRRREEGWRRRDILEGLQESFKVKLSTAKTRLREVDLEKLTSGDWQGTNAISKEDKEKLTLAT